MSWFTPSSRILFKGFATVLRTIRSGPEADTLYISRVFSSSTGETV